MTITVSPTQADLYLSVWTFLTGILPAVKVVQGQINRVPEPADPNFIVMTEISRVRLATNIDTYVDAAFTASIVGSLMTVASVEIGTVDVGHQVFGTGLAAGTTTILSQASGSAGGTGTYLVGPSQAAALQVMSAGEAAFLQKQNVLVQLDVHGPDGSNNATVISTLFRDPYGVEQFAAMGPDVVPLYADDPRQMPFINAEQQYEDRWVVEMQLQVNALVIGVPQQFAGAVDPALVDVEAAFPL